MPGGEDHAGRPGVELPQLRVGDVEPKLDILGNLHVGQVPLTRDDDPPRVEAVDGAGEGRRSRAPCRGPRPAHSRPSGRRARTVEALVDAERDHVDPLGIEVVLAQEPLALGGGEADDCVRGPESRAHQPPPRPRRPQVGRAKPDVEHDHRRPPAHPGDEGEKPRPERADHVRVQLPGNRDLADVPQQPVKEPSRPVLNLHAGRLGTGFDPELAEVIRAQKPRVRRRAGLYVGEQAVARIVVEEDGPHASNNVNGARSLPEAP